MCLTYTNKVDLCTTTYGGCEGPYNNKIKSVKFGNGVENLKLYKRRKFTSYYGLLTKDTPVLRTGWRGATSFLVTRPVESETKVCLYRETNFQGDRTCKDVAASSNLNDHWNDKIQSVQFGSEVSSFKMWRNANKGTYLGEIKGSQWKLDWKYRSFTSWLVIQRAPDNQVCCYTQADFQGTRHCFGKGEHNYVGDALNDKIKSIKFGAGVSSVGLYVDKNLKYSIETITTEVTETTSSWRDKLSPRIARSEISTSSMKVT